MKWKKFRIKTVTDAEDIIISTLYDIGGSSCMPICFCAAKYLYTGNCAGFDSAGCYSGNSQTPERAGRLDAQRSKQVRSAYALFF